MICEQCRTRVQNTEHNGGLLLCSGKDERWKSVALFVQRRSWLGMLPARVPTRRDLWRREVTYKQTEVWRYSVSKIGVRMGSDKYRLNWKEFEDNTKSYFRWHVLYFKDTLLHVGQLAGNCGWMRSTLTWAWPARTASSLMCTSSSSLPAVLFSRWLPKLNTMTHPGMCQ